MKNCKCGCGHESNCGEWHIGHWNRNRLSPLKGRKLSTEQRARMSESRRGEKSHFFGKHHTEETKKKISDAHRGKIKSIEHCKNISLAKKGFKVLEETKQKIREFHTGRKKSITTCQKISNTLRGHSCPDYVREKISKSHKGKVYSSDYKEKMSIALSRTRANQFIKNGFAHPAIGTIESQILDNLEKCFDSRIERQKLVDCYFVDGYCPRYNLAIEIDEPYHYMSNNILKEKDQKRQQHIEKTIKCKFLRIKVPNYVNKLFRNRTEQNKNLRLSCF